MKGMQTVILGVAALLVFSVNVQGQPGTPGSMGLSWTDEFDYEQEGWMICCGDVGPVVKTLYVFAYPPEDGMKMAELRLDFLEGMEPAAVWIEYPPFVEIDMGDITTGLSVAFQPCQTNGWVWFAQVNMLFNDLVLEHCRIELAPSLAGNFLGFATCASGFPLEGCSNTFGLDINYDYFCLFSPAALEIAVPEYIGVLPGDSVVIDFIVDNIGDHCPADGLTIEVDQTLDWEIGHPTSLDYLVCNCTLTVPVSVKVPEDWVTSEVNAVTFRTVEYVDMYMQYYYTVASTQLYYGYPVGVDESSWGAVKKIYE